MKVLEGERERGENLLQKGFPSRNVLFQNYTLRVDWMKTMTKSATVSTTPRVIR